MSQDDFNKASNHGYKGRRTPGVADIEAVATLAGVSTATVSRALRGLANVSPDTRERVLAAAKELNYVVSPSASRLASGRTHSVGVVTPYIGRPFFALVLEGAEEVLRKAGYDVLLYALPDEAERLRFFDRMPLRRRVDAVLVVTLPLMESQSDTLRDLGVPVGTVGMALDGLVHVGIDDHAAAGVAVNHLINLGHERIAMIGGGLSAHEPNPFVTPVERTDGFRDAMRAAELPVLPEYEVDGHYTPAGGEQAMAQLLSLPTPPTAVFAQSDRMAFGALRALRSLGLSCPDDLSLIGFGDHELAASQDLTTIAQPTREQGGAAARLLLSALDGQEVASQVLPTNLVLRASTAPPGGRRIRRR
jgi:LacI family repressor for deo operon, udp, cdd, tsx, nupC, and nupG